MVLFNFFLSTILLYKCFQLSICSADGGRNGEVSATAIIGLRGYDRHQSGLFCHFLITDEQFNFFSQNMDNHYSPFTNKDMCRDSEISTVHTKYGQAAIIARLPGDKTNSHQVTRHDPSLGSRYGKYKLLDALTCNQISQV